MASSTALSTVCRFISSTYSVGNFHYFSNHQRLSHATCCRVFIMVIDYFQSSSADKDRDISATSCRNILPAIRKTYLWLTDPSLFWGRSNNLSFQDCHHCGVLFLDSLLLMVWTTSYSKRKSLQGLSLSVALFKAQNLVSHTWLEKMLSKQGGNHMSDVADTCLVRRSHLEPLYLAPISFLSQRLWEAVYPQQCNFHNLHLFSPRNVNDLAKNFIYNRVLSILCYVSQNSHRPIEKEIMQVALLQVHHYI